MRFVGLIGVLVLFAPFLCAAQSDADVRTHFYDMFGWTVTIPEEFDSVGKEEWERLQTRGMNALENTIGEELTVRPEVVFIFRKGQFNYFEANALPYEEIVDGDYLSGLQDVKKALCKTFQNQIPGVKLDSISSVETIDSLEFQKFILSIEFPNGLSMMFFHYCRLFGKVQLTANIVYIDERAGEKMLEAMKQSRFD